MADHRPHGLPEPLAVLLEARQADRDPAWERFVAEYSDLILFAIRHTARDQDDVGDAYAYVLEQLRKDDCRRLRSFEAGGPAKLTTWLVVVVRRLAIDLRRKRTGQTNRDPELEDSPRSRLAHLISAVEDVATLPDPTSRGPERRLRDTELRDALSAAVSELPSRDRLLLAMRYEDGRSARAIAEAMGFPSQFHVYRRLKKTLARLRGRLEIRGIHGPDA